MRTARFLMSACVLAAGFAGVVHAEEYVRTYPVSGRTEVHVKADDGAVRVRPSSSSQVEFRVIYEGYTLDETITIESRQEPGRVELVERVPPTGEWRKWHNARRIQIEVSAPKDCDLRIETGDGGVRVSSFNGLMSVRTGDGAIDVSDLTGRVDLRTGDGAIRADRLTGELRLRTVDGAINGSELVGRLQAWTGDGSVWLSGRFEELSIASGDGKVVARAEKGSVVAIPWNIRTGDGSVSLAIPENLKADIDVATNDGGITFGAPVTVRGEIGKRRVRGELNGGGPELRIRSGDGSVRVEGI